MAYRREQDEAHERINTGVKSEWTWAQEVLSGLRIGSVPYLNARPLTYALPGGVDYKVPSALAAAFSGGQYDVALIPVFAALEHVREWIAVDDVAIACKGRVFSVILAYQGELGAIREIALDSASRTSVHLLRCLMAEYYRMEPDYLSGAPERGQARLLIGDAAITFYQQNRGAWRFLDLGLAWWRWTRLPFVFAVWAIRPGTRNSKEIAAALRCVKQAGLMQLDEIVSAESDPSFATKYLTRFIRYDLGDSEKQAIRLFAELCQRHGLFSAAAKTPFSPVRFI